MRIATWNINGLRARLDFMKIWLESRQPDVVGLQELKTPTDEFPHEFFNELGFTALVHGQKSWNGVAILTRREAELKQAGLPGESTSDRDVASKAASNRAMQYSRTRARLCTV